MSRFAIAVLLGTALWAAGTAARAAQPTRASQGVYTKAQAGRGDSVFTDVCVDCHTRSRFRGEAFAVKWADKPLAALYKAATSMPQGEPNSLDPQDYADVVAYLLSLNAYPEGPQELPPSEAAAAAIWVDVKAP